MTIRDLEYVVIDTETNGLPDQKDASLPDWSRVVLLEVGALHKIGLEEVDRYASMLDWPFPFEIHEQATALHGITHETLLCNAEKARDVLHKLNDFAPRGTLIVGHNLMAFDWHVLCHAYDMAGIDSVHSGILYGECKVLDTKLIWQAWNAGMRRDRFEPLAAFWGRVIGARPTTKSSLQHVMDSYGIHGMQEHRAMADCLDCARVFDLMLSYGMVGTVLGDGWVDA